MYSQNHRLRQLSRGPNLLCIMQARRLEAEKCDLEAEFGTAKGSLSGVQRSLVVSTISCDKDRQGSSLNWGHLCHFDYNDQLSYLRHMAEGSWHGLHQM